MRKIGLVIGALVAVIIVVVLILWVTFDVNEYRDEIQAELQNRIGRPVTLGPMELRLFPLSFQVNNLVIAEDPAWSSPKPFVQAERLDVSVKLIPLLRGSVEVTSLTLSRPAVELIKSKQGLWNFSSLGKGVEAARADNQEKTQESRSFSLGSLSVRDGAVALTDAQAGQPRSVYSHIDVSLEDFAPDKPFSLEVAIRLPGKGTQDVRIEGTGGPVKWGDVASTPLHATLELEDVVLAGLRQFLNQAALTKTDGSVTGKTRIDVESGSAAADGDTRIENARVEGVELGYPITAQYSVSSDLRNNVITIKKGAVQLGGTALSVTGKVDMKPTPAQLDLDVKGDNLSLAEAVRLASAFGVGFSPNTTVRGRAKANIHIGGTTDRPALTGGLSASDVRVSGKDIAEPVQVKSVNFTLTPTDIRSDEFGITSGGTTIKSTLALRQYASENPTIDANLRAPDAKLPAILALTKAYGVKALDNVNGSGLLNLDMRLSGSVKSLTGDQMLRGLNGDGGINFNDLRLKGANLGQEISKVAGFLKPAGATGAAGGFTEVSRMTGKITIKNGIAQTDDLKATLDFGTIGVVGSADLASQTLDLHISAVVPQRVSQQVGGKAIRGFMTTALANKAGELVIPVLVTGTFNNPKVSPDMESFGKMKLRGLLPTSSNPAEGFSRLLGDLLSKKSSDQQRQLQQQQQRQQQPTAARKTLQQVLEDLSGKKKQEKQESRQKPQK